MSVVVAVKKNGRAVIAADSLMSDGSLAFPAKHRAGARKIIPIGKSFFGIVGPAATEHVILSLNARYKKLLRLNSVAEIFETFRCLHPVLVEEYHTQQYEDEASYHFSRINAFIVNRHGAFLLCGDRNVVEVERFWAIGCGGQIALGAMHALYEQTDDPAAIARAGIHSACEFETRCALPMHCDCVILKANGRRSPVLPQITTNGVHHPSSVGSRRRESGRLANLKGL
jgi:ATP-dependent HslUV protease subunit HslV